MAKDDNCFPENCRVDPEFSVLLVAPCNTIPWLNGKPVVTQDLLDMMYRLQICGTLDYTPNLTESDTTKIGGCGAKDCFQKLESYEWTGPVQYCPGNCIIESLVHPTTPCTFDYIYLMYPEDCHNPSIDDIMWVGTAQTRPSGFSFDPRTDTGLRPDLAFKGCSRPMCILNDCCDRDSNGAMMVMVAMILIQLAICSMKSSSSSIWVPNMQLPKKPTIRYLSSMSQRQWQPNY